MVRMNEILETMRNNDCGWLIVKNGNKIVCGKAYSKFTVQFILANEGRNGLSVSFPAYEYRSWNADYGPNRIEIRLKRQKNIILHMIRYLKKVDVWKHIVNKDFVQVNTDNKKMTKTRKERLEKILNELA